MRLMILGATGLLGNTLFRYLSQKNFYAVFGTIRSERSKSFFPDKVRNRLIVCNDLTDLNILIGSIETTLPDVIINCTSANSTERHDPLSTFEVLSLLPQRLKVICDNKKIRLIHISSDGVFRGDRGGYIEEDTPDAEDLYGIAKILGEVHSPFSTNIRTSIIGPSAITQRGLVEWFLGCQTECVGYTEAVFSGLPTVTLSDVIFRHFLNDENMSGCWHVGGEAISKFDLLELLKQHLEKDIKIIPDSSLVIDRSLNCGKFKLAKNHVSEKWPDLIKKMFEFDEVLKHGWAAS